MKSYRLHKLNIFANDMCVVQGGYKERAPQSPKEKFMAECLLGRFPRDKL